MREKGFLAVFGGCLFGLAGFACLAILQIDYAFLLGTVCGIFFGLMLYAYLVVHETLAQRRYTKFEKEITSPVFHKTNGNFNLGSGKVKNGNIYFCEAGIVCVSLDEKPYAVEEVLLPNIHHYSYTPTQLFIFTNDGRTFSVTTADAHRVIDLLIKKAG